MSHLPHSPIARSVITSEARGLSLRTLYLTALCTATACVAAVVAHFLTSLIGLVTNLAYYDRFLLEEVAPAGHKLGIWSVAIPVVGGLLVGALARYGSAGIRGHGIPEAMEQILNNESRVAPRMTWLKPLASAIVIGTGGPFGAEGPIIATGGALGSLVGQLLHVTPSERKILLAAGAASGMTATFGSPLAATLLAVELLLFEFRAASLIPVALACTTAMLIREQTVGAAPLFPLPNATMPGTVALGTYLLVGIVCGGLSAFLTKLVYALEDGWERLPLHWVWWPAIGGLVVGLVGLWMPDTLGVGYGNIVRLTGGTLLGGAALLLALAKLISWSVATSSGTSGGTLAPLFIIGGGVGAWLGSLAVMLFPYAHIDVRIAALVGMTALFAGASRALLASLVCGLEITQQPLALLPLLAGWSSSYLVSCLLVRNSLMTEKLVRKGMPVPAGYGSDTLASALISQWATAPVVTLKADQTVESAREFLTGGSDGARHRGYPIVDSDGKVLGLLRPRDLLPATLEASTPLRSVMLSCPTIILNRSLREAVDIMGAHDVGYLPCVTTDTGKLVAILTRSDVSRAQAQLAGRAHTRYRHLPLDKLTPRKRKRA